MFHTNGPQNISTYLMEGSFSATTRSAGAIALLTTKLLLLLDAARIAKTITTSWFMLIERKFSLTAPKNFK